MSLLVISDFEGRRRGEIITETLAVELILASPHAACVVAVASDPSAAELALAAPSIPVED